MTSAFQVHGNAAVRKPRKKPVRREEDLEVYQVPMAAIVTAHALARGRDVHVKLGTGSERGVVYVLNGSA